MNGGARRREEGYKWCENRLMSAVSGYVEVVGSLCGMRCIEMAHLMIIKYSFKE